MFCISRNTKKFSKLIDVFFNGGVIKQKKVPQDYNNYCHNVSFCQTRYFSSNSESQNESTNDKQNVEIDYEAITKGDKELEHKLKVIILEAEVLRQEGKNVPSESYLQQKHWEELLNLPSRSGRTKYLEFLFKNSKRKENQAARKEQKKLERGEKPEIQRCESIEDFAQTYDLFHNNIFLRFYDTTINQMYNNKLIQAIQFGQKLVIDCGYDQDMSKRENINCAKQLMLLFADNRFNDDPFDLHFCNFNLDGILMDYLSRHIPTLHEKWFPLNIHTESYLDVFPKEQLVYLTPHCREEMTNYDHDAVYIVGGIVDKVNNQPLSMAKAKREGIRMAKFPLDKYLLWGSGSGKSLTLNQVVSILLDMKNTGDWKHALRHVPRRKLYSSNISETLDNAPTTLRFDKPRRERKWIPSSNVDFNSLKFNKKDEQKEKLIKIKNIFNE